MALKAGRVADYGGSLAEAIEVAMRAEWLAVKGEPMPEADPPDQRILFVAIARGLLGYLEAHQRDAIDSIEFDDPSGGTFTRSVREVDFDTQL